MMVEAHMTCLGPWVHGAVPAQSDTQWWWFRRTMPRIGEGPWVYGAVPAQGQQYRLHPSKAWGPGRMARCLPRSPGPVTQTQWIICAMLVSRL